MQTKSCALLKDVLAILCNDKDVLSDIDKTLSIDGQDVYHRILALADATQILELQFVRYLLVTFMR